MRDFAIPIGHRPGEVSRVATALAHKDVNIKSIAALGIGNQAMLHILPDDVEAARSALKESRIPFEEHELVTVLLENKAGELAEVTGKLANAGINLLALYVVGLEGELVELAIAADDVKKAKKVLE
jgi:hypothetical protein